MALAFLHLCHAQSCGKCVPCRIGLGQLSKLIATVLDGTADMGTIDIIEKTARTTLNTADCAIGRDAARLVLDGLEGFRDDYEEHIQHHRCLAGLQLPVPCVALCPAGVDVPGYMALVGEGRCADAVRLIRKDNPSPPPALTSASTLRGAVPPEHDRRRHQHPRPGSATPWTTQAMCPSPPVRRLPARRWPLSEEGPAD